MKLAGLSIFFPCLNEEANVEAVLADALRIAPTVADVYEIIIVDDGSTDQTATKVRHMGSAHASIRLVQHGKRRGYGEALRSGFNEARYPWIFFSDGDGQFDLNELPTLVKRTHEAEIISGYRARRADPWPRRLNAYLYALAMRLFFGVSVRDPNCAFKLIRRDALDRLHPKSSGALINLEILVKAKRLGLRIISLPVSHRPRRAGQQTGAELKVIAKAMAEFLKFWREHRHENN